MSAKSPAEQRVCPGERYSISLAICRTRQRNQYPRCLLCPHRSAEAAGSTVTDPKVSTSVFRPIGVLGHVPDDINEYVIRKVGLASAQFLRAETPSGSRLVVACDVRENSRGFTRIFCEGVNRGGMDTANIGTAPPDLLAFVLGTDGCTGAAFIGGGNYADDVNGVRLWRSDATPVGFGSGLEKVAMIARRLRTGHSRLPGDMTAASPLADYVSYVVKFSPDLQPLKLVVDAGCGSTGRVLDAVLADLPVETVRAHFEEDGHNQFLGKKFPSRAVASSVKAKVQEAGADLGAAFDFDGERIAFFDETGELLRHDAAAGLIAAELLTRAPGGCITYDLRSTLALKETVAGFGGQPVAAPTAPLRFAQDFRRNDALYGADLTGLHYFKDFFRFPSPIIALLMFCCRLSREKQAVSELAADLNRFSHSGEIVIAVPSSDVAQEALAKVRDEFQGGERDMIDGLTVRLEAWWFNLRQRGDAAELLLNVEGRTPRDQRRGRQTIERLVSKAVSAAGR